MPGQLHNNLPELFLRKARLHQVHDVADEIVGARLSRYLVVEVEMEGVVHVLEIDQEPGIMASETVRFLVIGRHHRHGLGDPIVVLVCKDSLASSAIERGLVRLPAATAAGFGLPIPQRPFKIHLGDLGGLLSGLVVEMPDPEPQAVYGLAGQEMMRQERDIGPELLFGHGVLELIDEPGAGGHLCLVAWDEMVEGQIERAGGIVFLEPDAGVIAEDGFGLLVPGGNHRSPANQLLRGVFDEFEASRAVEVLVHGRVAADDAGFQGQASFGCGER